MPSRQRVTHRENWLDEVLILTSGKNALTPNLWTGSGADSEAQETPRITISGPLHRKFVAEECIIRFEIPITSEARQVRLVWVADGVDIAANDTTATDSVVPITDWSDIGGTSFEGENLSGETNPGRHTAIVLPIKDGPTDNQYGNIIPLGAVVAFEFDAPNDANTGLNQFTYTVRLTSRIK